MDFASLKLIVIFLLLIKEVICFSQTSCISFGGTQNDYGYSIIQANDGNYVIAGITTSYGSGGNDLYIIKTDIKGNLLWSKTIGAMAGGLDEAYCVIQTNDDGYIITGSSTPVIAGGSNLYVVKLDFMGTLLWTKTIDGGAGGGEWGESIIQTQDSSYVIAGTTSNFSPGGEWDMYIVKLDVSGNLMWSKIYGGTDTDDDDFAHKVIQTQDGGFAIVGSSYGPSSGWYSDVNIVKLNSSGNLQWSRRIGGTNSDEGYSIIQKANGDYIISGYSASFNPFGDDLYIVKIDSSGNLLSSMGINYFDQGWNGYSIIPTFDGGYAIGGEFFIVKLDSNDNLQWASNYQDVHSLIQTIDSGFAFCGRTYIWNVAPPHYDIIFSKTDSSGLSCCGVADTVTFNNVVSTITAGGIITNVISTIGAGGVSSMGGTSFVYCYQCPQPISLTIPANNDTICQGQSVSLNVIASGGQPPYTYSWSPSTGLNNTTIPNPVFTAPFIPVSGTYTFTVSVSDSTCLVSNYVYITTLLTPVVQIIGNNYLCVGDSNTLSVNAPFYSYQWSTGQTTSAISIFPTTTTAYSVIVTYSNGCSNTSSYTVNVFPCNDNFQTASCLTIGGPTMDEAYSVIQSNDGGFIITGYTYSFGSGIYLIKLDSIGNLKWAKTLNGPVNEVGHSLINTIDGGYALGGFLAPISTALDRFYIAKFDSIDNIQWEKTISRAVNERAYSVIQTKDTGYVLSGFTYNGGNDWDMYITKLNSSGSLQWAKTIGGINEDWAYNSIQTVDGGFALIGLTSSFGAGYDDIYLVKLDPLGNLQWTKTFGTSFDDAAGSIIQTTDGGYTIGGSLAGDLYILRLDSSGTTQWEKTYGGVNLDFMGKLIQTNDEGYIMCGSTYSYGVGGYDVYVLKTDSLGNLLWSKTMGGTNNDYGNAIVQTQDGDYVIVGNTQSFSNNNTIYVIKLDSNGNSCCASGNGGIVSNITTVVSSGGIIGVGGQDNFFSSSVSKGGVIQSTCCPSPPIPVISGTTTICVGDSTTLTVSGGTTYLWNTGSTDSSIVVSPTITTNYFVTTFDTNNCSGNATVNVTVNNVNASVSGPTTICTGDSTLLSASGGILFQWSTGSTSSSISVSPTQTTTYSILVTDAMGCTNIDSITVSVNSFITALIIGDTSVCIGENTTLIASGGTMYSWSTGATSPSIVVSPTSTSSYSVIVTSGLCTDSAQITVAVNTLPTVTFTSTPASCSTCCDGGASVTASGNSPFTYLWNPGGQTASSATGLCAGNYTVCVTDVNGCMNCDTISINFLIGMNQFTIYNLQFTIEPNPFSDFAALRIKNGESQTLNLEFKMYDVFGRMVLNLKLETLNTKLERKNLPGGIYFYKIENENGIAAAGKIIAW